MVKLFGWEIRRQPEDLLPSFTPPVFDDGALTVAAGGSYGTIVDLEGVAKNEADLINKYRSMTLHPEVDSAVSDIVNEMIVIEDGEKCIELDFEEVPNLPPKLRQAIQQEFDGILDLLEFNQYGYDIGR